LGDVSKRIADGVAFIVDRLVQAKEAGQQPEAAAASWAATLEGRIRETLIGWGLADPAAQRLSTDAGRKLGAFIDSYIDGRTDLKPITVVKYKQTRRLLVEHFGVDRTLRSVTAADAGRWKRWLLAREVKAATETKPAKTMAIATVSKHVKRTKTMFKEAVRIGLSMKVLWPT
jgi:hypothetical protein